MSNKEIWRTTAEASLASLCEVFETSWLNGQASIETFLEQQDLPELDQDILIARLVQREIELRRQQGLPIDREDYLQRFPGVSAEVLGNLMQLPTLPPARLRTTDRPLFPQRYKALEQIGQGGIGSVWRVEDRLMERPLAAKVLLDKFKTNAAANSRLDREALLAGSLQHPGIPPVFERGELLTGSKFFTMKLVEGQTLDELLHNRNEPFERRQYLLGVFRQIAEAVGFAHSKGVIHRDLKPQNVMVGEFGEVQIMDWGMAKRLDETPAATASASNRNEDTIRPVPVPAQQPIETNSMSLDSSLAIERQDGGLTLQGDIFGTPSYMSPEQAQGNLEQLGERSDVFSLGAILLEILTGRRLYQEFDADEVIAAAARCDTGNSLQPLQTSDVDEELVALCKSCLDCDAEQRPANGQQVAVAVSAYITGVEQRLKRAELETAASEARASEARKRLRTTIALITVAFMIAVIGLTGIAWKWQEANRNFKESQIQSAAREVYFSKSLAAVDQMLTRVGSKMLANVPQMSKIRGQLLTDALTFYNELLQDSPDDPSLKREFGRIQKQVGVIHQKLGDYEQASEAYRLASQTFRELREEFPDDFQNVLDYGIARSAFALSVHEVGRNAEAETVLREVIALLDENQQQAGNLDSGGREYASWMQVQAEAHTFLAMVVPSTQDSASAITELELACKYFEEIPEEWSTDSVKFTYASTLEILASHLERINQVSRSVELRNQAVAIIESLLEVAPESPEYRNTLANIQQCLSGIMARQGKLMEAAVALEQEIDIRRKLVADFPSIPRLKQDYARCLALHGSVLNSIGDFDRAQHSLEEAVAIAEELVEQFPDTVDYQQEVAFVCQTAGTAAQIAGGQKNLELSNTYYQKAYAAGKKIVALAPRNARYEYELALSARNWSVALLKPGSDDEQARALLDEAIVIFAGLSSKEPDNTDYLYQLAFTRLNFVRLLTETEDSLAAENLELACQSLNHLIELQPEEPRYRMQLTRAYDQLSTLQFQLGRFDAWEESLRQANRIIERVVEEFGRDAKLVQFLTISKNRLAHCLEVRGEPEEANQLFHAALTDRKQFVDANPGNEKMTRELASSHGNIAWNLAYWQKAENLDMKEAERYATLATELDSEAAEHWTCLAHTLYRQGDFAAVDTTLTQCESVNEPDQMARLALQAMAHWQLDDLETAHSELTDAIELRDSDDVQQNINARLVQPEYFRLVDEAQSLIQE